MNILLILNDGPYATERPYNALRLAGALAEDGDATVRLFLLGDGVFCAVRDQTAPAGFHDIEWMLRRFLAGHRTVAACGSCMDARGVRDDQLVEGVSRSNLPELTEWTKLSERVIAF